MIKKITIHHRPYENYMHFILGIPQIYARTIMQSGRSHRIVLSTNIVFLGESLHIGYGRFTPIIIEWGLKRTAAATPSSSKARRISACRTSKDMAPVLVRKYEAPLDVRTAKKICT